MLAACSPSAGSKKRSTSNTLRTPCPAFPSLKFPCSGRICKHRPRFGKSLHTSPERASPRIPAPPAKAAAPSSFRVSHRHHSCPSLIGSSDGRLLGTVPVPAVPAFENDSPRLGGEVPARDALVTGRRKPSSDSRGRGDAPNSPGGAGGILPPGELDGSEFSVGVGECPGGCIVRPCRLVKIHSPRRRVMEISRSCTKS